RAGRGPREGGRQPERGGPTARHLARHPSLPDRQVRPRRLTSMRSQSWRRRGLLVALALATAAPPRLRASGTSPALVLSAAAGAAAGEQRSVALDGSFDFANAVQVAYPLNLVVFQGSRFVRYRVPGDAVAGDSPELADGQLTSDELDAFGREGSAAAAGVRIVDLVVRAGTMVVGPSIPPPSASPRTAVAGSAAMPGGSGIPFTVAVSDGSGTPPSGNPLLGPEMDGIPVLVVAFADLDGDGVVGPTNADDGGADDDARELQESDYLVGRQ